MKKVIIAATYFEQLDKVAVLLESMKQQTADNYELHILSNADETVYEIPDKYPSLMTDKVFLHCSEENTATWGVWNRVQFIETCKKLHPDTYIITTSSEDYYAPTLIEEINKQQDKQFIYWDFVTHAFEYKTQRAMAKPFPRYVDWGSFALAVEEWEWESKLLPEYMADGLHVAKWMKEKNLSHIRIPKLLMVKN